jgi:hypothetical protein
MPDQTNKPPTATYTSCDYHPKIKIPIISCIPHITPKISPITATPTFAQQRSFKGRKRVTVNEIHNTTEPIRYLTYLNTARQELLRLHETYVHADMKEIQQDIKNCNIKATRQVELCQIAKCISCCENKGKHISHKRDRCSITQDDEKPASNTSINHVDAANFPGYTCQHK